MLITTTDVLQGIEIAEYIGPVYARVADGRQMALRKGYAPAVADLSKKIREDLEAAAQEVGADAVIGLRINAENLSDLVYGTAVKLKK